MKNKQIIELLGPNWEKFSEIILKYHKEINKGLDRQPILTQVIYLDKVINDFKFIFNMVSDMNVDLGETDWGRALLDIFLI